MPRVTKTTKKDNGLSPRLEFIGEHFDEFQKNGDGYKALCPLHGDTNPSLSLKSGDDGRVLMHCHAGCRTDLVLEVVGLSYKDLMADAKTIVATYDYRDPDGNLLHQVVRYWPKDFRQRAPDWGRWMALLAQGY